MLLPLTSVGQARSLAVCTGLILLTGFAIPAPGHSLDIGAGFHTNFDGDHRRVYGAAPAVSVGFRDRSDSGIPGS